MRRPPRKPSTPAPYGVPLLRHRVVLIAHSAATVRTSRPLHRDDDCRAAHLGLRPMESLIAAVREQEETARFLAWPGDFDLDRGDHVEEVHLASGAALEGFAGDGAGGTYFFCGEGGEERPVLYADSEGGAALVAIGLPELVRLLLVVPWWRDCQTLTSTESRELEAEYREDNPDLVERPRCCSAWPQPSGPGRGLGPFARGRHPAGRGIRSDLHAGGPLLRAALHTLRRATESGRDEPHRGRSTAIGCLRRVDLSTGLAR